MQLSKLADPLRAVGRSIGLSLWSTQDDADSLAEAEGAKRTRPPTALETLDFSWLTLDEVLQSHPGLLATRLHIITLRQFRESIGDEWEQYIDRIGMIADGVVRRLLGPKNYFSRYSEDTFILSFSALSEEEGRRQAVLLANELMHRLIGERFASAQICVSEIDTEVLVDGKGGLQEILVDEAVTEAEPIQFFEERFESLSKTELVAMDPLGSKGSDGTLDDVHEGGNSIADKEPFDPVWVPLVWPPEELKRRLPKEHLVVKPGETVPEGIEILFRPTWTARWQMVDAYLAQPRRSTDGRSVTGDAALPRGASTGQLANLDYALLYATLAELTRAVEAKKAATFICPIRFSTLVPPYWATIPEVLRCFSDAIRQRNLLIEITHIPPTVGADHMTSIAGKIRPFCRDILFRTMLDNPRVPIIGVAQPAAIGCRFARGHGDAPNLSALATFVDAAKPHRVYLWGITDPSILNAALVDPSVSLVNGPVLADDKAESEGSLMLRAPSAPV